MRCAAAGDKPHQGHDFSRANRMELDCKRTAEVLDLVLALHFAHKTLPVWGMQRDEETHDEPLAPGREDGKIW
jgi:hypothetical protein